MKKHYLASGMLCLMLFGFCLAMAQAQTGVTLPKVLWIFREDIKPARGASHERVEHGLAQLWSKAHVQPFLGLDAVSGNANETLFLSGYESFEAFGKDFQIFSNAASGPMKAEYDSLQKQEAELVNSVRSIVAVYRAGLSYHMDSAMPGLPMARYMQITTMRTRLGKDEAFAEGAKVYRSAYEKINSERPWAIYQVISGAPAGTYLMFEAIKSLKDIDDDFAMESKLMAAMGEETLKNMSKGMADTFISIENSIYSFNPRISHVPKAFADVDPEFWAPKPKPAEKPATEPKKP